MSELSPLYGEQFSRRERQEIQAWNREVIRNGFDRYTLQLGEKEIFLHELNINGVITNEASLKVLNYEGHTVIAKIEKNEKVLCRRKSHAMLTSMRDWSDQKIKYWQIGNSFLDTSPGYEGNGFGTGMLFGTEEMLPAWAATLQDSQRVIAVHIDNSRGAEQDSNATEGYRAGWTTHYLAELNYSNNPETLEYYLGATLIKQLRDSGNIWVKEIRG